MHSRDLFLALALVVESDTNSRVLANRLGISVSQAFSGLRALEYARLLKNGKIQKRLMMDFVIHGVKVAFAVQPGTDTLGMPTGICKPLFDDEVSGLSPYVWPSVSGTTRGLAIKPLWKSVPFAAGHDRELYRLLAAVDAIRVGRAREVNIARTLLKEVFGRE